MKNIKEIVEELSEQYPLNTFGGETKEELLNVLSKSIDKTREETIREMERGLPEPRTVYHNKGTEEFESNYAYNYCLEEIKQALIQLRK